MEKMAKAKNDMSELYRSYQLTPEQKAAARKRLEAQSEEAARNRVWEKFRALQGKVKLTYDVEALREDRD
jgi:hypothetical protein